MQVSRIEKRRRRILIRVFLDMQQCLIGLEDHPEVSITAMAVRLGEYDRRPMDMTALATMTTLPRTTVIRHVKHLEKLGRIKMTRVGRRSIPRLVTNHPKTDVFYRKLEKIVIKAAATLSKLDTSPVDIDASEE